jgi:hypothetical protein
MANPLCFATDDAFYGACSWDCSSAAERWDAPTALAADCIEWLNGDNRCFVVCADGEACPDAMQCVQGSRGLPPPV